MRPRFRSDREDWVQRVVADGDAKTFMAYDPQEGKAVPDAYFSDKQALTGTWDIALKDGKKVSCSTAHTLLLKKLEDYDPKTVSEITGVPHASTSKTRLEMNPQARMVSQWSFSTTPALA